VPGRPGPATDQLLAVAGLKLEEAGRGVAASEQEAGCGLALVLVVENR
jgi:hypothetical protein